MGLRSYGPPYPGNQMDKTQKRGKKKERKRKKKRKEKEKKERKKKRKKKKKKNRVNFPSPKPTSPGFAFVARDSVAGESSLSCLETRSREAPGGW